MRAVLSATILCLSLNVVAQQNVVYNGQTFKPMEVNSLHLGAYGESFSLDVSEIDLGPGGDWAKEKSRLERSGKRLTMADFPANKQLLFSVIFKNGLKFPITPADSIVVSLSGLMDNLNEEAFVKNELSQIDMAKVDAENNAMQSKKEVYEKKAAELSKQMKAGKISPQELITKMEELSKPLLEAVDSSYAQNVEIENYKDASQYDIIFFDSTAHTESQIISGNLHIVEFNKQRLVAYIKGQHIVICNSLRLQNDKENKCRKPSALVPNFQILEEGEVYLSINSSFNEFSDHRN